MTRSHERGHKSNLSLFEILAQQEGTRMTVSVYEANIFTEDKFWSVETGQASGGHSDSPSLLCLCSSFRPKRLKTPFAGTALKYSTSRKK